MPITINIGNAHQNKPANNIPTNITGKNTNVNNTLVKPQVNLTAT